MPRPSAPRSLDAAIGRATEALLDAQREDGHWVFELEADATIPAEYVLLMHYLGETPRTWSWSARSASICAASRATMAAGRSFTAARSTCQRQRQGLFRAQDDRRRSSMRRTWRARAKRSWPTAARRQATSSPASCSRCTAPVRGARCRPCRSEIILLPRWFPFHLSQDVLLGAHRDRAAAGAAALKPLARNPRGVQVEELFVHRRHVTPSRRRRSTRMAAGRCSSVRSTWCLKRGEPLWPSSCASGPSTRAWIGHRAAERRGRARRDLSRPWPTA